LETAADVQLAQARPHKREEGGDRLRPPSRCFTDLFVSTAGRLYHDNGTVAPRQVGAILGCGPPDEGHHRAGPTGEGCDPSPRLLVQARAHGRRTSCRPGVLEAATLMRFGPTEGWTAALSPPCPIPDSQSPGSLPSGSPSSGWHGLYRGGRIGRSRGCHRGLQGFISARRHDPERPVLLSCPTSAACSHVVFPLLAVGALGVRIAMRLVLVFMREHGRNTRFMLVLAPTRGRRPSPTSWSHTRSWGWWSLAPQS